jgi:hypothetical protein
MYYNKLIGTLWLGAGDFLLLIISQKFVDRVICLSCFGALIEVDIRALVMHYEQLI